MGCAQPQGCAQAVEPVHSPGELALGLNVVLHAVQAYTGLYSEENKDTDHKEPSGMYPWKAPQISEHCPPIEPLASEDIDSQLVRPGTTSSLRLLRVLKGKSNREGTSSQSTGLGESGYLG